MKKLKNLFEQTQECQCKGVIQIMLDSFLPLLHPPTMGPNIIFCAMVEIFLNKKVLPILITLCKDLFKLLLEFKMNLFCLQLLK